jgi:hypothetical protein
MFAHVSCKCRAAWALLAVHCSNEGAPPHYHRIVRAYLDDTLPDRWIGRRGAIECPPRSPDFTPLDLYLWGTLKDEVYRQKPATRETIEAWRAAMTPDTLTAVVRRPSTLFSHCWSSLRAHNDTLSLRARIVSTCHFVPKILTIKRVSTFFGPLSICIYICVCVCVFVYIYIFIK